MTAAWHIWHGEPEEGQASLTNADGEWVADTTEEHAHVIVTAVNAHDDLLSALSELLGACEADAMDDKSNVYRSAMIDARAAIAKAEGR